MLHRHIRTLTLTLLSAIALAATRAEAVPFEDVVIDLFDVDFLLSTSGTITDGGGYLGSRSASVASGSIQVAGGNLIVLDDISPGITAAILWPSAPTPDSDLVNGDNSFFELEVADVSGSWTVSLATNDGIIPSVAVVFPTISAAGTYMLDFSAFTGITFTSIDQLALSLTSNGAVDEGSASIQLAEFRAVPEPGTGALLGLGLLGLALGSPRRRVAA